MYESFDAFEYVEYLRRRWRVVALACGVAFVVVLTVSLLLPKRYTATASILIETPGSNDVRTATAVSPVYLESLKTYESFAQSDSLFTRAVERFHLQQPGASLEGLKRRILKVSKIRDTKILEISATLNDPKTAQSLAQFIAEETASASHNESLEADKEVMQESERQAVDSQARFERAQKAWTAATIGEPIDALQAEVASTVELQSSVRQQLIQAEADVADYQQQAQSGSQFGREQLQAAKARVDLLNKRLEELGRAIQAKSATVSARIAKRETLQAELKMAQAAYESTATHVRDLKAGAGTHAERLRVIDPGIVPQRPSSPNIFLNVALAVFVALIASIVYLSLAFTFRRRRVGYEPEVSHGMRA